MKIFSATEMPQGSDAWKEAHRGRATASSFNRIITAKTAKPAAAQDDFINELIADRLGLGPMELPSVITRPMQAGIDNEPEARRFYELEYADGFGVEQVGFLLSDCGRFGCSPDGLVGDSGILELKFPLLKTHIGYLRDSSKLLDEYRAQCHAEIWMTGREWCDLMSYTNTTLPSVRIRVKRDSYTEALGRAAEQFAARLEEALVALGLSDRVQAGQSLEVPEPPPGELLPQGA